MSTLSPEAEQLRAHMAQLCCRAWGCDWVDHLEYALWHAMVQGPMRYGRLELTAAQLAKLRALRDACGGWIMHDRTRGIRFVPLDAWQDLYSGNVELIHMDRPTPPPDSFAPDH